MAVLKDTLIQGSARVTDTLYADTIQGTNLNASLLDSETTKTSLLKIYSPDSNAAAATQGINFYTNNVYTGHIGSSTAIGVYSTGQIFIRPGNGSVSSTYGVTFDYQYIAPRATAGSTGQVALGTADYRWNGVYSSTGNFSGPVTITGSSSAAPLTLTGAAGSYREGIRIKAYSSWSDIVLCGNDLTAESGISANSWFIGNNNGNFYITRNGSTSSSSAILKCVSNVWTISGTVSASISGTSMGLYRLEDTRETTTQPNNYNDKILFTALKRNTVIGITSDNPFSYVVGLRGWGDSSGGDAHELAFNDDGIFCRHGATTSWGSWAKLLDTTGGTLTGDLTLDTAHAVHGILGTFNTTTSTDCGGLSWHEVNGVGPSATVDVNDAPNTDWWYVLRNRHTNTIYNYYTDIALPFNSNGIYYKVIRNNVIQNPGVYNGWVKVLDEFGGIFETSSALEKYGNNTSWVNARDGAIIRRYRNLQGETTASLVNSGNYDIANGRYVAAASLIGLYYTWSIAQYTNDTLYFDCTNNDHYNSATNQTVASISMSTSGALTANQVYGAVWNDYAEYRKQLYKVEPGRVVYDLDDGYILPTDKRLQPGAQVVSDTFGFAIGETEESKTPLAVTGRVLVYTYRDRYEYHAGDAVCSAPNGTVDIMTREEIKEYPDAIIGIVSEIPSYKTWGTSNVPVNGRIWIKVR